MTEDEKQKKRQEFLDLVSKLPPLETSLLAWRPIRNRDKKKQRG